MQIEKLARELGISQYTLEKMLNRLDGAGFTDDQTIAIIKCIIAWAE